MKCTGNKKRIYLSALLCFCLSICLFTSCGLFNKYEGKYDIYETSHQYGILKSETLSESGLFASDICVPESENINTESYDASGVLSCGLFNGTKKETLFAKDIYHKIYPASTTKVMTCLVAIKYGDLDLKVTVTENALDIDKSSSVAGLKAGDEISIRQLLYGLMLVSGNDAAVAIAEGMSGSVDSFVSLMNTEADMLGATNTNYVNSNGLPDDMHYTTVYDMYLILNEAAKYEMFTDIIKTSSYEASYTDSLGNIVTKTYENTNRYLNGRVNAPENISVIGGKTGTTSKAGYCLLLLSRNERGELLFSFVFGAENVNDLYSVMNGILSSFGQL